MIYCVGLLFGSDTDRTEARHARRVLEALSEQTGGAGLFSEVGERSRCDCGGGGAGYPDAVHDFVPFDEVSDAGWIPADPCGGEGEELREAVSADAEWVFPEGGGGCGQVGRRAGVDGFREAELVRVAANILELVGHTPMVRLGKLVPAGGAEVWAKLEYLNPGGSVKDRAALGIVLDAERRGVLRPGDTIVEATAGNTGIGLALIGINRGYKVMLYVPQQFAEEKCMLMRGLGATVVRTPEAEGMAGAIERALKFEAETPGAFAALQFENPANPDFHEETTAVEIWEQMDGRVDAWVCGVGSAGTFTGVARFLKGRLGTG